MKPNPLVSIILPVYNVEGYIEQSIRSVFGQSYQHIELIVVDDCGHDCSMAIVKKLCEGKSDVRLLQHERNRGLSAARNTGLSEARGEWIFFMDSDDLLTPNCLEVLIKELELHPDVEMIVGQYDEFAEGEPYHPARWKQSGGVYEQDVIGAYMQGKIPATAWNKLVRKDFLEQFHLSFEEGLVHEDALWSFQTFCMAQKVAVSSAVTYHYLQRSGSLDKQENVLLHAVHYNRVYCLQAQFVFDHHLEHDSRLYAFIEKARYQLLTDMCLKDPVFASTLYRESRKYPYWQQWHRNVPSSFGFWVYIRLRCWYLRTFKGF